MHTHTYKVGDLCRGRPEGPFFNSYYTKVLGSALLHSQDCPTPYHVKQGGIKYHFFFF